MSTPKVVVIDQSPKYTTQIVEEDSKGLFLCSVDKAQRPAGYLAIWLIDKGEPLLPLSRPMPCVLLAQLTSAAFQSLLASPQGEVQMTDYIRHWARCSADEIDDGEPPAGKGAYTVTLRVAGSRLKSVQKAAEQAFGEMLLEVSKDEPTRSRSQRLDDARASAESAKETVEELRDELESWKDNLPENLQFGSKADELDEAISNLEELSSQLEEADFSNVTFPGMF